MAIIDGREYGIGTHTIGGYIIQVIDNSTYRTVRKVDAPEPEPVEEPPVRFARININTARPELLEELDGVGKAAARRIVASRPFDSVDDLVRVKGVSEKTVAANRERITA